MRLPPIIWPAGDPEWSDPIGTLKPEMRQRDNETFYVWQDTHVFVDGKRKRKRLRRTLGTNDLKTALAKHEQDYGKKKKLTPSSKLSVGEAKDEWMVKAARQKSGRTIRKRKDDWARIGPHLDHLKLSAVTREDCLAVIEALHETVSETTGRKLAHNTKAGIFTTMSAFFTWCMSSPREWRDDNPCHNLGEETLTTSTTKQVSRDMLLSEAEVDALSAWVLAHSRRPIKARKIAAMFELGPELGCRVSELVAIRISDVALETHDTEWGEVTIERQLDSEANLSDDPPETWFKWLKGEEDRMVGRRRVVPLSPWAHQRLQAYLAEGLATGWLTPDGLLFPSYKGTPFKPSSLVNHIHETGLKAIGKRVVPHMFRHTFASRQFDEGATVGEVAFLLGDTEKTVRDTYIHVANAKSLKARVAARGRQLSPVVTPLPENVVLMPKQRGTKLVPNLPSTSSDLALSQGLQSS